VDKGRSNGVCGSGKLGKPRPRSKFNWFIAEGKACIHLRFFLALPPPACGMVIEGSVYMERKTTRKRRNTQRRMTEWGEASVCRFMQRKTLILHKTWVRGKVCKVLTRFTLVLLPGIASSGGRRRGGRRRPRTAVLQSAQQPHKDEALVNAPCDRTLQLPSMVRSGCSCNSRTRKLLLLCGLLQLCCQVMSGDRVVM
jgi:hypothetical protein